MSAPCAIWQSRTYDSGHGKGDLFQYESPRAGGRYEVTGSAKVVISNLKNEEKARLTSWLIDQRSMGTEWPLITQEIVRRAVERPAHIVSERRDKLLLTVSSYAPSLGTRMQYREAGTVRIATDASRQNPQWAEVDYLLAATESIDFKEVKALIDFSVEQKLIEDSYGSLSLTFAGHSYIESLRAKPTSSSQGFVAMWFSEEVREAYDNGIEPAIAAAGYKPMRLDRKEHNNKIDDEIIAEIRRSRFVVADFTCGIVNSGGEDTAIPRGGVYYEAGFAQGLGIPVIWACRSDHIKHVHFDTRQFNHITWSNPEELRDKLRNRIGAVIGDGPLKTK